MIALVDCNNFYCSCERLFRPDLEGRPVVVLSNNDGCAISRSEEAKAIGIQMGTPEYLIRDQLKKFRVAVFSSNYTLYGDLSNRVMKTLASFAPELELYSIDEAFLDLQDLLHEDLLKLGMRIRKTIAKNIGIPVTVGIAPTKTLAKMANRYAKKRHRDLGVFWAASKDLIQEILNYTEVEDIWGIGSQYAKFLRKNGFKNAADLTTAPEEWVRKNMTVAGQRLLSELKGIPAIAWDMGGTAKKNIRVSRSFGKLITDRSLLTQALINYTVSCAEKLRKEQTCTGKIAVFVETNPFRPQDKQYRHSVSVDIAVPTNDSAELIGYARKGLDMIFREGYRYLKCGITVMELVPQDTLQGGLFDKKNRAHQNTLMQTMDRINLAMGRDTLKLATQGFDKPYRMRANLLSGKYTTRIGEILTIHI